MYVWLIVAASLILTDVWASHQMESENVIHFQEVQSTLVLNQLAIAQVSETLSQHSRALAEIIPTVSQLQKDQQQFMLQLSQQQTDHQQFMLQLLQQLSDQQQQNTTQLLQQEIDQQQFMSQLLQSLREISKTLQTSSIVVCPSPFQKVGNECFFIGDSAVSWDEGRIHCNESGGELASPTNLFRLKAWVAYQKAGDFWIGGNDREEEGTWIYINGQPIDCEHWHRNQPNNYNDQDCLMMDTRVYPPLNDAECTNKYFPICQFNIF